MASSSGCGDASSGNSEPPPNPPSRTEYRVKGDIWKVDIYYKAAKGDDVSAGFIPTADGSDSSHLRFYVKRKDRQVPDVEKRTSIPMPSEVVKNLERLDNYKQEKVKEVEDLSKMDTPDSVYKLRFKMKKKMSDEELAMYFQPKPFPKS